MSVHMYYTSYTENENNFSKDVYKINEHVKYFTVYCKVM